MQTGRDGSPIRAATAAVFDGAPGRCTAPIPSSYSGTMRSATSRVRLGMLLVLALAAAVAVAGRLRAPVGRHAETPSVHRRGHVAARPRQGRRGRLTRNGLRRNGDGRGIGHPSGRSQTVAPVQFATCTEYHS